MGCGGGSSKVTQQPLHTPVWGDLEAALANLVAPAQQAGGRGLMTPEYYPGERLAQIGPEFLQMGRGALENLQGGWEDVFAPITQQAQNLWQQQIMPNVMERFAGMGNALSGGAASALAREGQNLSTNLGATLAPMWMEGQMAMPGLAQGFGSWEQAGRQQPLDLAQQLWGEEQGWPQVNPYFNAALDVMGQGGSRAMENIAQQGSPGFLTSMAPGLGQATGAFALAKLLPMLGNMI